MYEVCNCGIAASLTYQMFSFYKVSVMLCYFITNFLLCGGIVVELLTLSAAMGSGTSYTSQLTLANTEEPNVGVNYTCTASLVSTLAFIDSSDSVSNSTTIPPQSKKLVMK